MTDFTPGETALLAGLLAHAVAIFFALWFTRKQVRHEVDRIAHDVHAGVEKIEEVRTETTTMRKHLESVARANGKAEGVIEGRAEEKEDERKRKLLQSQTAPKARR